MTEVADVNERLQIDRAAINVFSPQASVVPQRQERYHTLISVDDHLVEPPEQCSRARFPRSSPSARQG